MHILLSTFDLSIISEYNDRVNLEKELSLEKAKKYIKEHPKSGDPLVDEKKYLTQVGCYYFFGESDRILSFTLNEILSTAVNVFVLG